MEAYLHKDDCLSKSQLTALRSDSRTQTFEEAAAKKYNDPAFNPSTLILPDLHEDFAKEIKLLHKYAPTPVTPEKIKDQLADVRPGAFAS